MFSAPCRRRTARGTTFGLSACLMVLLASSAESPAHPAAVADAVASSTPAGERPGLVLHVESADGTVIETVDADLAINPASVVKAATTLWALENLGPGHRFETGFGYRGTFDRETGVIDGDLIVTGSGDPDFHVENAYLVAAELWRLGVREVRGDLRVDDRFWLGWEGGIEKREADPARRERQMAGRLRDALDPVRFSVAMRRSIEVFEARRGLSAEHRPRVVITGEAAGNPGAGAVQRLVVHRSNPLVAILKRFNAYSNNDIERLGATLGTPAELAAQLTQRFGASAGEIRLSSLSGLATNRLTPRQMVRLLRDLDQACRAAGIALADVLPVAGCDPGTLKFYPRLREPLTGNLAAKTGTLNVTDDGVSVLAGVFDSAAGERIFCVATPRARGRQTAARARQEQWVLDLVAASGGAAPAACGRGTDFPDQDAEIVTEAETPLAFKDRVP